MYLVKAHTTKIQRSAGGGSALLLRRLVMHTVLTFLSIGNDIDRGKNVFCAMASSSLPFSASPVPTNAIAFSESDEERSGGGLHEPPTDRSAKVSMYIESTFRDSPDDIYDALFREGVEANQRLRKNIGHEMFTKDEMSEMPPSSYRDSHMLRGNRKRAKKNRGVLLFDGGKSIREKLLKVSAEKRFHVDFRARIMSRSMRKGDRVVDESTWVRSKRWWTCRGDRSVECGETLTCPSETGPCDDRDETTLGRRFYVYQDDPKFAPEMRKWRERLFSETGEVGEGRSKSVASMHGNFVEKRIGPYVSTVLAKVIPDAQNIELAWSNIYGNDLDNSARGDVQQVMRMKKGRVVETSLEMFRVISAANSDPSSSNDGYKHPFLLAFDVAAAKRLGVKPSESFRIRPFHTKRNAAFDEGAPVFLHEYDPNMFLRTRVFCASLQVSMPEKDSTTQDAVVTIPELWNEDQRPPFDPVETSNGESMLGVDKAIASDGRDDIWEAAYVVGQIGEHITSAEHTKQYQDEASRARPWLKSKLTDDSDAKPSTMNVGRVDVVLLPFCGPSREETRVLGLRSNGIRSVEDFFRDSLGIRNDFIRDSLHSGKSSRSDSTDAQSLARYVEDAKVVIDKAPTSPHAVRLSELRELRDNLVQSPLSRGSVFGPFGRVLGALPPQMTIGTFANSHVSLTRLQPPMLQKNVEVFEDIVDWYWLSACFYSKAVTGICTPSFDANDNGIANRQRVNELNAPRCSEATSCVECVNLNILNGGLQFNYCEWTQPRIWAPTLVRRTHASHSSHGKALDRNFVAMPESELRDLCPSGAGDSEERRSRPNGLRVDTFLSDAFTPVRSSSASVGTSHLARRSTTAPRSSLAYACSGLTCLLSGTMRREKTSKIWKTIDVFVALDDVARAFPFGVIDDDVQWSLGALVDRAHRHDEHFPSIETSDMNLGDMLVFESGKVMYGVLPLYGESGDSRFMQDGACGVRLADTSQCALSED
eukprot:g5133.t1